MRECFSRRNNRRNEESQLPSTNCFKRKMWKFSNAKTTTWMLTALKAKNGLRYPAVSLSHLTNIRFRYWPNCNKKHPIPNRQNFWETTKDKWIIGECHHSQQILSSRALLPLIGYHLPILRTPYSGHIVPMNAFLFICMRGKNITKFEKNFSICKRSWYLSLATTN